MSSWLFFTPIISAFIGWIVFRIGIKMLFYPKEPKRIFGFTFQGIFPRRQKLFAEKFSQLITRQLLSISEIEAKVSDPANVQKILPVLETHIDFFLREKLPAQIPMLGMLIGDKTIGQVKAIFLNELEEMFPAMMKQYITTLQTDINLENIITEKVLGFSSDRIELLLKQTMSFEFRLVEIIGAVLGLIIGIVQVLITLATT